ncbi:hypothetical protein COY95_05245, partial [Candidatus Woesearchaeota archaeon CG_4_10_14_0_8_um_filter_47_5]
NYLPVVLFALDCCGEHVGFFRDKEMVYWVEIKKEKNPNSSLYLHNIYKWGISKKIKYGFYLHNINFGLM